MLLVCPISSLQNDVQALPAQEFACVAHITNKYFAGVLSGGLKALVAESDHSVEDPLRATSASFSLCLQFSFYANCNSRGLQSSH